MRLFVALTPPPEAIADLDGFLEPRRSAASPGLRWAATEQFHVTLAFLGDVPDRRLDELTERLTRAAAKRRPVHTRIAGGGAFPNVARSKVLWAGLDLAEPDREEVRRMAVGARTAATRTGLEVNGSRFRPHVTLARLGRPQDTVNWVRLLDGYAGPAWSVTEWDLVASYLGEGPRGRPRYETVAAFPIGPSSGPR